MGIFQEVKYVWRDQEYTIPPERVMRAIAIVERNITLKEITAALAGGQVKLIPIAEAYADLLHFAGCDPKISGAEEVYAEIFGGGQKKAFGHQSALMGLLALMVPPETLRKSVQAQIDNEKKGQGVPLGKEVPTTTAEKPSKKRTRSRSALGI